MATLLAHLSQPVEPIDCVSLLQTDKCLPNNHFHFGSTERFLEPGLGFKNDSKTTK